MLSNHPAVEKKVDKFADQDNKLYVVLDNVIMVSLSKIYAEEMEPKSLHLTNAENDFLSTSSFLVDFPFKITYFCLNKYVSK